MLTRAKSRLLAESIETSEVQHPISDIIRFLRVDDVDTSSQSAAIDTDVAHLKLKLDNAFEDCDFNEICDILLSSRTLLIQARNVASDIYQDVLDHCLYSLCCRPQKSGRFAGMPYVYFWSQDKEVRITEKKFLDILEFLLAAGANPRSRDSNGLTFFHWLAQRREEGEKLSEIVHLVYDAGCDIEAKDGMYGATPLGWSSWFG